MLEFFSLLVYNDFRWINTWRSRLVWSRAHDWKSCNRQKRFEGSNLSFSAKIKGCPVGHLFIFDGSLYVGEIRTKASIKQSCELFLAVTEAIRKAHIFIRRNCFEDSKNESLLLRQNKRMSCWASFYFWWQFVCWRDSNKSVNKTVLWTVFSGDRSNPKSTYFYTTKLLWG